MKLHSAFLCIFLTFLMTEIESVLYPDFSAYIKKSVQKRKIAADSSDILCQSTTDGITGCMRLCFETQKCSAVNFKLKMRICECLSEDTLAETTFEENADWQYFEIRSMTSTQGNYRLVGGKSYGSGRVEHRDGATQPWGTVCDPDFGLQFVPCWLCRQSGFNAAVGAPYTKDTHLGVLNESYPISVKNLGCNCERCVEFNHGSCTHDHDIYLYCK